MMNKPNPQQISELADAIWQGEESLLNYYNGYGRGYGIDPWTNLDHATQGAIMAEVRSINAFTGNPSPSLSFTVDDIPFTAEQIEEIAQTLAMGGTVTFSRAVGFHELSRADRDAVAARIRHWEARVAETQSAETI